MVRTVTEKALQTCYGAGARGSPPLTYALSKTAPLRQPEADDKMQIMRWTQRPHPHRLYPATALITRVNYQQSPRQTALGHGCI
ncbi:hypothetical protein H920_08119 [Fukomys damarensis]|uniref:Uncharacterized protein n=1 Tax=Fukomys damarensis TaxID=885580 RepID=A0A091DJL7_FUKDA|nr:hypothetical protein H920_08119 [Fukomys damarensis]